MSEHNADCDVYDMTEDLVLTGKPCNCNRRAVLLRVAGELDLVLDGSGAWFRDDVRDLAAKYRKEAE